MLLIYTELQTLLFCIRYELETKVTSSTLTLLYKERQI